MDFFEAQEQSRASTTRLVLLFALAVLTLVLLTVVSVGVFVAYLEGYGTPSPQTVLAALPPLRVAEIAAAVLVVVLAGTLYKMAVLSGGGRVVAENLGGVRVSRDSSDTDLLRLLNVVEEMAIASGTPVPPVYLLEHESGINAFAAGFSPRDAVIGVTRGAVRELSREQLQGVIAHEFSHILNGDMRLNLRLMGVLHGILVVGYLGRGVLRSIRTTTRSRSRRGGGGGPLVLLALALLVIGYGGVFFGNLIKAAVSRQREFLADASAVQFTRDPGGIAGALKRIGGLASGSLISSSSAAEASHLFFGAGLASWLGMLATHPPLEQRIRRIDSRWDGKFDARPPRSAHDGKPGEGGAVENAVSIPVNAPVDMPVDMPVGMSVGKIVDRSVGDSVDSVVGGAMLAAVVASAAHIGQVGRPGGTSLNAARALLERIPPVVRAACAEAGTARVVVCSLLLDPDAVTRSRQLLRMEEYGGGAFTALAQKLQPTLSGMPPELRLPVLDLALPALHGMSDSQRRSFARHLKDLAETDAHTSVFEWVVQTIAGRYLEAQGRRSLPMRDRNQPMSRAREPIAVLLSALAHAGAVAGEEDAGGVAARAFEAGAMQLNVAGLALLPTEEVNGERLAMALRALEPLAPHDLRRLLEACAACIHADRLQRAEEVELLRAVCAALECPLPALTSV
ncbi:MAG: M48 family metallopeptidase [Nitrospirota bacterium]|nr:M48 family metallopeptidase [Nitrospirota bacterium]